MCGRFNLPSQSSTYARYLPIWRAPTGSRRRAFDELLRLSNAPMALSSAIELPRRMPASSPSCRSPYKSSGRRPVCFAILTSITGPISSLPWKANVRAPTPDG